VLGRGCGKTFSLALFAVLMAILYPKTKIGCLGPSARQGDLIFNEVEALFNDSDYFKASTTNHKVSRSPVRNIVKFSNGSFIESTPIGQGGKVRGARYNIVCLDEYAQFDPEIINLVIKPFLAVKRKGSTNKLIESSSAFYKHNHLYERYKYYKKKIEYDDDSKYFLANYDYRDVLLDPDSPFEMDMEIIRQQKETMTESEFQMEWLGQFPDESDTFFTSKLVEEICTPRPPAEVPVKIELSCFDTNSKGERINNGYNYILGVDIAKAPGQANFALGVGKIVGDVIQPVNMITLNGGTYTEMVKLIRECTLNYNVIRIQMDRGGGGEALKEELAKPWIDRVEEKIYLPILDMDDEETANAAGLRYLRLINFQGSKHSNLFTNLKAEMEHKRVQFPINQRRDSSGNKELERAGQELIATKRELMVVGSKPRGANLHFEPPTGFNMDRAVALTLIVDAILDQREPQWHSKIPEELPIGQWA
jgi:hypothetical protein